MVDNSAPAVDAQQIFKSTFKVLINEDIGIVIDTKRYQRVLEHALSKVDFSVGIGIYILPSNLNLIIGIQQQNFSEQDRHESWFKQRYQKGP